MSKDVCQLPRMPQSHDHTGWLWGNLPADSPNLPVSKSAKRFSDCHQICQSVTLLGGNLSSDSPNLPVSKYGREGKSTGRFGDCQKICHRILGGGICWQIHQICQLVNLPADSPICRSVNLLGGNLPVSKSARGESAGRNTQVFLPVVSKFFS